MEEGNGEGLMAQVVSTTAYLGNSYPMSSHFSSDVREHAT
jgi:hypothetical protein